jgi:hypothetical protein
MRKPNSKTTRLREWIAYTIDPMPPMGEAWCMKCSINGGKTAVISAAGLTLHVKAHTPGETIFIKRREPV